MDAITDMPMPRRCCHVSSFLSRLCLFVAISHGLWSSRAEWILVHLDRPKDGAQSLHFEVTWLVASGRHLDELLMSWTRRAERLGLHMIEAPYYQSAEDQNEWPFQTLVRIPLAVKPPPSPLGVPTYEEELLLRHHFLREFGEGNPSVRCPSWHGPFPLTVRRPLVRQTEPCASRPSRSSSNASGCRSSSIGRASTLRRSWRTEKASSLRRTASSHPSTRGSGTWAMESGRGDKGRGVGRGKGRGVGALAAARTGCSCGGLSLVDCNTRQVNVAIETVRVDLEAACANAAGLRDFYDAITLDRQARSPPMSRTMSPNTAGDSHSNGSTAATTTAAGTPMAIAAGVDSSNSDGIEHPQPSPPTSPSPAPPPLTDAM